MTFKEKCENGIFLETNFNGSVDGLIIGPDFYLNQLNVLERIFFGIVFFLLSAISVVGNGYGLLTAPNRKLQALYKCCIVSQSLGDLLMALFVGLNSINNFIQDTVAWTFGDFMCGWIPFVTTMSALLSSMILTCIALDRYQGVVLVYRKWDPKLPTAILIVSFLWVMAAGTTVPTFMGYNQISACFVDAKANTSFYGHLCLANQTIGNYYFFTLFTLIFLPLLVAFVILYGVIARMMWLKKRRSRHGSKLTLATTSEARGQAPRDPPVHASDSDPGRSRKNRVFTLILIIMATFIVCRLPQWIFIVISTLPWNRLTGNFWWIVKYLLSALSLANTTINPFIYSFLSQAMNLKSTLTTGLRNFKNLKLKYFGKNLKRHRDPSGPTPNA